MTESARSADAPKTVSWPYTSFKSLLNFFDRLEAAKAVPAQIDRGVLGGSEGQKTLLLATLKFFNLVGENGAVNDNLRALVEQPKERQRIIKELLAKHYPAATALAAVNGTTRQLEDAFTGMQGDTLRKAMTFYLHAAKYAGHPTSKFFKVPSGFNASRQRRQRGTNGSTPEPAVPASPSVVADPKARYLEMLMERAKASEQLDTELLDRIERLLGYETEDE